VSPSPDDPFRFSGVRRIRVPRQPDLFNRGKFVPANNVRMGYFYELLTQAYFGGKVVNHLYYERRNAEEGNGLTKPDVVDGKRNRVFESKANRSGHQLLLLDEQMQRYQYVQATKERPEIFFVVYRHTVPGIRSYKESEAVLWNALAKKTFRVVVLPFSVVHQMYGICGDAKYHPLVKRYDNPRGQDTGYNCARVRSPTVNAFLDNPHVSLAALGLDPERYRWRVGETPGVIVDGIRVGGIPFAWIQDADHAEWASRFVEEFHRDVPF
jgi:hypothetical protein